ncbi:MAG TPA: chemotaxis response regulator protein-glutamate methylesterase [Catenuloplanes sp.]|jgi:two-component system chemotaxis response regulator CheB
MVSVLVVDDSVVMRRLITEALAQDAGISVVGTAPNGRVALQKIDQLSPDVVTLDIEMPVLDGLATLRELRPRHPRLPVIMFSTLTAAGAGATLDALAAGASDYVTKPANAGSVKESMQSVREQLIPRIHALSGAGTSTPARPAAGRALRVPAPTRPPAAAPRFSFPPAVPGLAGPAVPAGRPSVPRRTTPVEVIAVGCSTGGPDALSRILQELPGTLPVPVVVVQHMPPMFTRMFAERLNRTSALTVVEATDNQPLRPGTVYLAPGDFHLSVTRRGAAVVTRLESGPPENFCRPAVDVLFRSVAHHYRGNVLAVILTGMGQDGRRGAEVLRAAGAEILAQDQATSVVWGMPGAVVNAGLADDVLPLSAISRHLSTRLASRGSASPMQVTR